VKRLLVLGALTNILTRHGAAPPAGREEKDDRINPNRETARTNPSEPPPTASFDCLQIGGLYVLTVDGLEDRRIIYAPPGHRVIPAEGPAQVLEEGALLCNLTTYLVLAESEIYREWVDRYIVSGVRAAAVHLQSAAARRGRRNEKRLCDRERSRAGARA
jgi:hypothetical protein